MAFLLGSFWGFEPKEAVGCNRRMLQEGKGRFATSWEDEGRKFRLEKRTNGVGRFVLCSILDLESKRFCLVFPEGKGLLGGWAILAEKSLDGPREVEMRAFVDVGRVTTGRVGDTFWLQLGGRELLSRGDQLGRCLVGRWGEELILESDLVLLKRWGELLWNLKGGVRFAKLGGLIFLMEFENGDEAERVLKKGVQWFQNRVLRLERWNTEAGSLQLGNPAKEVWVRVVGLPLHFWNGEVFRKIGNYCGGFVGVDNDMRSFSQLQWARILVKSEGIDLPRTL